MEKEPCFSIYNHILLASVLTTRLDSFLNTGQLDFSIPFSTYFRDRALCAAEAWRLSCVCHVLGHCQNALLT